MRKRGFIGCMIFLMVCISSISAIDVNLVAYPGSFGVDLASGDYPKRTANVQWQHDNQETLSDVNFYQRKHTVAHGGIFGIALKNSDPTYTVRFECPNGFNFTNNSNPAYIRPFKLQVVQNWVGNTIKTVGDGNLIFEGMAERTYTWAESGCAFKDGNNTESKFDLLLVLEGTVTNGVLDINGQKYPLAEGEYSAVVNIIIEGYYTDEDNRKVDLPTKIITIPFSGYYYEDENTSINVDSTVGVSLVPSANAANLDIRTMGGQDYEIATLDVLKYIAAGESSTHDYSYSDNPDHLDNDLRIFLSSSPNPFVSGGDFSLVHTSVPVGGLLTNANHVGYTVFAVSNNDRTDAKVFRGGSTVYDIMNASADPSSYIVTDHTGVRDISGTSLDYHTYNGRLYIRMNRPVTSMLPGIYRSTVYVHVVVDDDIQGGFWQ